MTDIVHIEWLKFSETIYSATAAATTTDVERDGHMMYKNKIQNLWVKKLIYKISQFSSSSYAL